MAADALAHPPLFTPEESARLRSGFIRSMVGPDEWDSLTVPVFGWATSCWQCGVESYVWMDVNIAGPDITRESERADVREALLRNNPVPHALIGKVTTKAGGTYLGFTCPWCHAVHGKHFLKIELYRKLLDDESSIDKHHFEDRYPHSDSPKMQLTALAGATFPATRARQFIEWRARMDELIAYHRNHAKFPPKREDSTIYQTRLMANTGKLPAERRAYLDIRLPGWNPGYVPAPKAFADRVEAIAVHQFAHRFDAALVPSPWPLGSSTNTAERRLASWLLSQRMRSALGKMKATEREALDRGIPGWNRSDVPDWYSYVLRLAETGLDTRDPELVGFLSSQRARFGTETPNDDDRTAVLDAVVPGWEQGPGFDAWMKREAAYARAELDAGADDGHDMIHDVVGWDRRCTVFFRRLDRRYAEGRVPEAELDWLCAMFETLTGYLGITDRKPDMSWVLQRRG
jgi:hypothetical protein